LAAFVQAVNAQANNAATVTSAGITTTSGNSIIAIACNENGRGDATTPFSDNKGNTWTEAPNGGNSSTGQIRIKVFSATNITGGSGHTFSYSESSAGFPSMVVLEFSGMTTATFGDVNANTQVASSNAAQTINTGSMTTLNANDVIIAGLACGGAGAAANQSFSAVQGGGVYTIPTNGRNTNTSLTPIAAAYQIVSATATYQASAASGEGTNDSLSAVIASFIQAAAAGFNPANSQNAVYGITDAGMLSQFLTIGGY
jgi:hypothetical protein